MFINVFYKDAPELSAPRLQVNEAPDTSVEKTLLVNPNCPVRIMLEYIRKKCRLGIFTQFDMCDESGNLKGLFTLPTYAYATDQFEHKKTYYLIVFKVESDKNCTVLPQLNRENRIYFDLKMKVKKSLMSGDHSNTILATVKLNSPLTPPAKVSPATPAKASAKKK